MDAKSVRLLAELCATRVLQVENLKALLEVEVSRRQRNLSSGFSSRFCLGWFDLTLLVLGVCAWLDSSAVAAAAASFQWQGDEQCREAQRHRSP